MIRSRASRSRPMGDMNNIDSSNDGIAS